MVVKRFVFLKTHFILLLTVLLALTDSMASDQEEGIRKYDFESEELEGKLPKSLLVLSGTFSMEAEGENHVLKLHETPLYTHGLLIGEESSNNLSIAARIRSVNQRRTMPRFGVGLNGIGGYKLRVTPAKRLLELYKGKEVVKQIEFEWTPGTWTWLALEIRQLDESKWQINGKAWCDCAVEPEEWMLSYDETSQPFEGPPSLWGTPYSSKPIFYDDIVIRPVE